MARVIRQNGLLLVSIPQGRNTGSNKEAFKTTFLVKDAKQVRYYNGKKYTYPQAKMKFMNIEFPTELIGRRIKIVILPISRMRK